MDASPPGRPDVVGRQLSDPFGAHEVVGLQPSRDAPDDEVQRWVRERLWRHGVVCLRLPRKLTDDELRSVVELIGEVKDPIAQDASGAPRRYGYARQVIDSGFVLTDELREALGDVTLGGDDVRPGLFQYFHTDDSYVEQPALATVLHARALPSGGGGATSFIDMRAAYDLLDADVQSKLAGLVAVHAYNNHDAFPPRASASGELEDLVEVAHPIVRAHPFTARAALYFDLDRATHVVGMPDDEGRALLQSLQDHAEQRAPRYDHAWLPHDLLIWDNVAVQHRAQSDFPVGEPRRFWRYMVVGPQPLAFSGRHS